MITDEICYTFFVGSTCAFRSGTDPILLLILLLRQHTQTSARLPLFQIGLGWNFV